MRVLDIPLLIHTLFSRNIVIVIDSLYYPSCSYLIVAAQKILDTQLIFQGNFILLVAEAYRYPFLGELYRVLSLVEVIDYIFSSYPIISISFNLAKVSDCKPFLDKLWNRSTIVKSKSYLDQNIREIRLIYNK